MAYLLISDPGTYIGSKKEQFKISFGSSDKPVAYVPANRVEGIVIDTNATLTNGSLSLLANYGIPVIWNDFKNDGMILLPYKAHGSVDIRREQYAALYDQRAIQIAIQISKSSGLCKLSLISRIKRRNAAYVGLFESDIGKMKEYCDEYDMFVNDLQVLDLKNRQHLMSHEAKIAKVYFQILSDLFTDYGWEFKKRSRRPAENPINALLNYGYAILKGQLTHALAITGLDIFAGFLHTDRSGRESLVLDIMEEFRQVCIDEVVVKLIMNNLIDQSHFSETTNGIEITKEGKSIFIPAVFDQFNRHIRDFKLRNWFIRQGRILGKYLRGQIQYYEPFVLKVMDPW